MNLMTTLRRGAALMLTVGALALSNVALAQPPGGGMPPEMQAKLKKFMTWMENSKNLTNLSKAVYQIQEIDKEPSTRLDKKQSATVLATLKSWRNKPAMTDDQAKGVVKQISSVLNMNQIQEMQSVQLPWGGRGGGRPGSGGGRPGGGGPGGGFKMPEPPKNGYNPLNPDTLFIESMRPQAKKRMDDFIATLAKRK